MEIKRDRLWSEEDEWAALEKRLRQEGLNHNIGQQDKLIHVWRWLVDAENNLQTSRKMLDKLRDQHDQEMKEVEYFVETLKDITDARVAKVEEEKQKIMAKLQTIAEIKAEDTVLEIAEMLKQEGLEEISTSPISEQMAYLLVERSRLIEEITMERRKRKGRATNLTDNIKLNSVQMQQLLDEQKADFEEELRFQQQLAKEVKEQMKKYHEDEMRQIQKNLKRTQTKVAELNIDSNADQKDALQKKCQELEGKVSEMADRLKVMKKAMRELENENENLIYKLSEAMAECDEQETLLRKMRLNAVLTPSTSLPVLSEVQPQPPELPSPIETRPDDLLENKIAATKQELAWVEQIHKLQDELKLLEEQLLKTGEQYAALATKYERRKIQEKSRTLKLSEQHKKECSTLHEQIINLEKEIAMSKSIISKERIHRLRLESDLRNRQEENESMYSSCLEKEEMASAKAQEISLLKLKVNYLEERNHALSEQLATFKKISSKSTPSSNPMEFDSVYPRNRTSGSDNVSAEFSSSLLESKVILGKLSNVLNVAQLSLDKQEPVSADNLQHYQNQIDSGVANLSLETSSKQSSVTSPHTTTENIIRGFKIRETFTLPLTLQLPRKTSTKRRFSHGDIPSGNKASPINNSLPASPVASSTWPVLGASGKSTQVEEISSQQRSDSQYNEFSYLN